MRVFSALFVGLLSLPAFGQDRDKAAAPPSNPSNILERTNELLRRLNLPPDPKLDAVWVRQLNKKNACLDTKALEIARTGAKQSEITVAACRACDREIVESQEMYFAANKHRFMEPNLDNDIRDARKECLSDIALIGWKALRSAAAEAAAKAAEIVDRVKYGGWGSWLVEARVQRDGLLSYVLIGGDVNAASSIEVRCYPVSGRAIFVMSGPYMDSDASGYATYSIDGESLKQVRVTSIKGGVVGFAENDNIWARLIRAKRTFHISVQSVPAVFDMLGYSTVEADWLKRCVG